MAQSKTSIAAHKTFPQTAAQGETPINHRPTAIHFRRTL